MAGYGDQGYNQDFYESGYDMDGVQQTPGPQEPQQAGWQQQAPTAVPAQTQAQWSGAGQQQAYHHPTSYDQQGYGQQGAKLICLLRMTYCAALTLL